MRVFPGLPVVDGKDRLMSSSGKCSTNKIKKGGSFDGYVAKFVPALTEWREESGRR